jgi:hypothetical protein
MLKYPQRHIFLLMGREKVVGRPFGQREYDLNNFMPTLSGTHYKFTLLLPINEKFADEKVSRTVFTADDLDGLKNLFRNDFNGLTYFEIEGPPPVQGDWVDKKGKIVTDWHARIEVYTKRHEGAVEYFEELKARLLLHAKVARNIEQEDIVIERSEADFVRNRPLGSIIAESEERLKNLRR